MSFWSNDKVLARGLQKYKYNYTSKCKFTASEQVTADLDAGTQQECSY